MDPKEIDEQNKVLQNKARFAQNELSQKTTLKEENASRATATPGRPIRPEGFPTIERRSEHYDDGPEFNQVERTHLYNPESEGDDYTG